MRKKNILPMAVVALVVAIGYEKYRSGAIGGGKANGGAFKIGV